MNDSENNKITENNGNTIDLIELFNVVWKKRNVVLLCTLTTFILSFIYLHMASYTYTAVLKVTPIQSSASNLTGKLGGLGNLASLAGVSLPTDQSGLLFRLYVEGLHSRFAADAMAQNVNITKVIYAFEWDEGSKTWIRPSGPAAFLKHVVKLILGMPDIEWQPPSGALLQQYIDDNVKVSEDPKSPIVSITYDNKDPKFAVLFLSELNKAVDDQLRQKALLRSAQNVEYLSGQLKTVTLAEQREAIMQALSEQEKAAMMANSTASFSADSFGYPAASFRPTRPKPTAVMGSAILAGMLIGVVAAFMASAGWFADFGGSAEGQSIWSRVVGWVRRLFGTASKF